MKPANKEKTQFEKVPMDDFVIGTIEAIEYDQEHLFKGYNGAEDKIKPAVRFKFKIENLSYSHYSNWMSFSYAEKANLYIKYLTPLVSEAAPNMDFDLDRLKGMKLKMLWTEFKGFQKPETIRPFNGKIDSLPSVSDSFEPEDDSEFKPEEISF